jgi:hypothetical protein
MRILTVVSLRNAVLNAPTLCKIGDLGPVLIWVCVGTESAAVTVTRGTMHCGQAVAVVVIVYSIDLVGDVGKKNVSIEIDNSISNT